MCDYSLEHVSSREAKIADRLVSTAFWGTTTKGFACIDDQDAAICLRPGTELSFDEDVRYDSYFGWNRSSGYKTAVFREVNQNEPGVHHDALEFPNGRVVLVTRIKPGQKATVLQLPATEKPKTEATEVREERVLEPAE